MPPKVTESRGHPLNSLEMKQLSPLRSTLLTESGVTHGIITYRTMSLPLDGDTSYVSGAADRAAVAANRACWSLAIGVPADRWVCARQVHGTQYAVVREVDAGRGATSFEDAIPATDILVSNTPGLALTVFSADCTPILLWDQAQRVAAAVHAGWRGTVANAASVAVEAMRAEFGSRPGDVRAFIGPSIGPCCYEVGGEVIEAWRQTRLDPSDHAIRPDGDRAHFDLWRANQITLVAAGVRPQQIEVAGICTMCHADRWFSHRASGGSTGRFAAVIVVPSAAEHGQA